MAALGISANCSKMRCVAHRGIICASSGALADQNYHRLLSKGGCRVTNPHEFETDGVAFLGTSGQNVADVLRYSEGDNACAALARILEWGHLVPTAPDTLAAYPFATDDPFVLRACPHVLFAGNQHAFATRMVAGGAQ